MELVKSSFVIFIVRGLERETRERKYILYENTYGMKKSIARFIVT